MIINDNSSNQDIKYSENTHFSNRNVRLGDETVEGVEGIEEMRHVKEPNSKKPSNFKKAFLLPKTLSCINSIDRKTLQTKKVETRVMKLNVSKH